MKNVLIISIAAFFIFAGCNTNRKDDTREVVVLSNTTPAKTDSIKNAIEVIARRDIETTGNTVTSLQVDGLEITRISAKDYYETERKSQEVNFNNYLASMEKLPPSNPLRAPLVIEQNKEKHKAVMQYLDRLLQSPGDSLEMYKVVYYLHAITSGAVYDQMQTTYLDRSLNKKLMNYSGVQVQF